MAQQINSVADLLHAVADPEQRKNLALPEDQHMLSFIIANNYADKVVIPNENDITNKNEFYADLVNNTFLKATKSFISSKESETMAAINQYLKDTNDDSPIKKRLLEIIANYNKHNDENNTERAKLNFDNNGNLTLEEHKTGIFEKIKDFCQRNKNTLNFLEYTLKFSINMVALLIPLATWSGAMVAVGLLGLHFGLPLEAIGAIAIGVTVLGIITWNAVGKFAKKLGLDKPFIRINNWLTDENGNDKSLNNVGDNLNTKFGADKTEEKRSGDIKTTVGEKEVVIKSSEYGQDPVEGSKEKM